METEFVIPAVNMVKLDDRFKSMANRAKKLGATAPSFEVLGKEDVEMFDPRTDASIGFQVCIRVKVLVGDSPTMSGWKFVGTVDSSDPGICAESGEFLLFLAPGVRSLPRDFMDALKDNPARCDHCGQPRRRAQTYVVLSEETGEYKLVGKSCLKDFVGGQDPSAVVVYYQFLHLLASELDDEEGELYRVSGGPRVYSLAMFLSVVCSVAREDGFLSSAEARKRGDLGFTAMTTAQKAWMILTDASVSQCASITPVDKGMAAQIIDWAPSQWDGAHSTDYTRNLKAAFSSGRVSEKTAGLIASLYRGYEKHLSVSAPASSAYGAVGDKVRVSLTCTSTRRIETRFGVSVICKFDDGNGHVFVWFNSGKSEVKPRVRYAVSGTIKGHNELRETALTRCRVKPL